MLRNSNEVTVLKGVFITNKYYTDYGMDYVFDRLSSCFNSLGHSLSKCSPALVYGKDIIQPAINADFVMFWHKDFYLARAIEKQGIRVFNSARVLELCDDKQKTYSALSGIEIPKTISAPLMYDVNDVIDSEFLHMVEDELGYPVIVKENVGSQGRQVYIANNYAQLLDLYKRLRHMAHHYQCSKGEFGADVRVYVAGHKVIACVKRENTIFKSNIFCGGTMKRLDDDKYSSLAVGISKQLGLDFGAVDFLLGEEPIFLEVNSNAYFKGIEDLGIPVAQSLCDYVVKEMTAVSQQNLQ